MLKVEVKDKKDDSIIVEINYESTEIFDQDYGDIMPVVEFIECCETGVFNNYDGYAKEIILSGRIIAKEYLYPSDVEGWKGMLLQLKEELGDVQICWYNR